MQKRHYSSRRTPPRQFGADRSSTISERSGTVTAGLGLAVPGVWLDNDFAARSSFPPRGIPIFSGGAACAGRYPIGSRRIFVLCHLSRSRVTCVTEPVPAVLSFGGERVQPMDNQGAAPRFMLQVSYRGGRTKIVFSSKCRGSSEPRLSFPVRHSPAIPALRSEYPCARPQRSGRFK
jgi:hypothetical protein